MVSPIDKLLPWRASEFGLQMRTSSIPCCFRGPMLQSHIHAKWVPAAFESALYHMYLLGVHWQQVWLKEEERIAPAQYALLKREQVANERRKLLARSCKKSQPQLTQERVKPETHSRSAVVIEELSGSFRTYEANSACAKKTKNKKTYKKPIKSLIPLRVLNIYLLGPTHLWQVQRGNILFSSFLWLL